MNEKFGNSPEKGKRVKDGNRLRRTVEAKCRCLIKG